jgi:two-component system cell cycle sensor histidine kinase/response regulator CckA
MTGSDEREDHCFMSHTDKGSGIRFFRLESQQGARELQMLADISRQLQNIDDLPQQLSFILQNLKNIIRFDKAALFLYNHDRHSLRCQASVGLGLDEIEHAETMAMRGYPGWVLRSHQPLLLPDIKEETDGFRYGINHNGSLIMVPVISGDRFIGVISAENYQKHAFGQWEVYLLTLFANQIAMTMGNADQAASVKLREKKFCHLFDKTGISLFNLSLNGSLTEANKTFLKMTGYESKSDMLRLNFFDHFAVKDKALRQLLSKSGSVTDYEIPIQKKDGSLITVLFSCIASKTASGRIIGFDCFLKDINENRKWTDQLYKIQKMASLGSMTSGIAHDFNNLLSGIIGCASMLLSDIEPSNPHFEDAEAIMAASKKAADLARLLLTFSKEKTGAKSVSVNDLFSEILKILSRTMDKNITIKTYFFPGIALIEADPTRIQQALMNICLNARDAMPDGGELCIETENTILDGHYPKAQMNLSPGDYVLIRIRDTGTGIDPETMQHIFEPYFTTKEPGKGNGLGLAIAQDIVKNLDGEIFVSSKNHHGTTFEIYLPVYGGLVETSHPQQTCETMHKGNETLLLVDDEEVIRNTGKRMLERYGYNVLSATDGRDALKLYKKSPEDIDLLILDMVMPKMNGKETLRQIRKINPNVKAILASGYLQENDSDKCLEEGFLGFIPKPFQASHILRVVRRSLDGSPSKSTGESGTVLQQS